MYIVVEYNDGKELFLDGDGQKYFMEELAEAEATGDEILVENSLALGVIITELQKKLLRQKSLRLINLRDYLSSLNTIPQKQNVVERIWKYGRKTQVMEAEFVLHLLSYVPRLRC